MTEKLRKNAKLPEWPKFLINLDKFLREAWSGLKREWRRMLNWFMYYKPTDKKDKKWHFWEMVIAYIILQFAVKGVFGY